MSAVSTLDPPTQPPSLPSSSSSSATASLTACAQALDTPELLIKILGKLDQKSLGRTSRVNKCWLDASTIARMSTVMPMEYRPSEREFGWLIAQLLARPSLGHYIKHINLRPMSSAEGVPSTKSRLGLLMSLCTNISSVAVRSNIAIAQVVPLLRSAAAHWPALTRLKIDLMTDEDYEIDDLRSLAFGLRSLHNLKHLELTAEAFSHSILEHLGSRPSYQLESLEVGDMGIEPVSVELLRWFCGDSSASLRNARVVLLQALDAIEFVSDTFKSLERVFVLTMHPDADKDIALRFLALPQLKKFKFVYVSSDSSHFLLELDLTGAKPKFLQVEHVPKLLMKKVRQSLKMAPE